MDQSHRDKDLAALRVEVEQLRSAAAAVGLDLSTPTTAPQRVAADDHYLKRELYERVRTDATIFEFLQAGSLDGIWFWDLKNPDHEWMSPRFWELLGYAAAERQHLASEWKDLIDPDDLKRVMQNFDAHVLDPEHPYDQIVRYRHRDGSIVWVRCRGIAIRDENGTPVRMLGAHNDITAAVRAEQRAAESERLASLGTLAAGVAHQINNPLSSILAACEYALMCDADDDDDARETLREALRSNAEETRRCGQLVRSLLQFARGDATERCHENLGPIARHALLLVQSHAQANGTSTEAGPGCSDEWSALVNPLEIEQVIVNLMHNAIEANAHRVELSIVAAGSMLEIRVQDDGRGIDDSELPRVFDPFFTTRHREGGTGLGLSVAHGIARRHGGALRIDSRAGEGTTATLVLPRPADEVSLGS